MVHLLTEFLKTEITVDKLLRYHVKGSDLMCVTRLDLSRLGASDANVELLIDMLEKFRTTGVPPSALPNRSRYLYALAHDLNACRREPLALNCYSELRNLACNRLGSCNLSCSTE